MSINYRIATISDLVIVLEMVQEFHQNESLPFDQKIDGGVLKDCLTDEELAQVWLIHEGSETIGYIILTLGFSLEYRGRDAFVDELYLRPNYRGRGIGTQTLAFAEEACRELGVQALHLEVDFENPDAQRFYHKVGYKLHKRFLMTKAVDASL